MARHKVDEIVDAEVPHAIFILHAAQARVFGQFQGDFHDLAACGLLDQARSFCFAASTGGHSIEFGALPRFWMRVRVRVH